MGKINPKSVDNNVVYECVAILQHYMSRYNFKLEDFDTNSGKDNKSYNVIVDAIMQGKADELLNDLYENDKVSLRAAVKQAIQYLYNKKENIIASRIIKNN